MTSCENKIVRALEGNEMFKYLWEEEAFSKHDTKIRNHGGNIDECDSQILNLKKKKKS